MKRRASLVACAAAGVLGIASCVGDDPAPGGAGGGDAGGCIGDQPEACGPSCERCAVPRGGRAACESGQCKKVCDATGTSQLCGEDCVDTAIDPNHCGGCGRSCGGAACRAGLCEPAKLTTALPDVRDFDVDGSALVLGFGDKVLSCALPDGCPSAAQQKGVASGYAQGGPLWTTAGDVFFTGLAANVHGVFRCTVATGCPQVAGSLTPVQSSADAPVGLAFRGGQAVWTRRTPGDNGDEIYACALPACAPASILLVRSGLKDEVGPVLALAADASTVFYGVEMAGIVASWAVRACPLAEGCTPTTVVSAPGAVRGIAVVGQQLFVANAQSGVRVSLLTGKNDADFATDGAGITDLAADEGGVYWTNAAKGTVNRCPLAGCSGQLPELIATDQANARRLRLTATHVYWLTDGGIKSLPRPAR